MAITYEKMKTYTVPDGNDKVQYEIVDDAGRKMIAPDWDVSYDEAFAVGDYVVNNGKLYRFTSPHTAGDAWDDEEVTEITVTDEIQAIKSDVSGKASKVSGATSGHFAGLDVNGNPTDSGYSVGTGSPSDSKLWSSQQTFNHMSNFLALKTDKVTGATENNFAALTSSGNLKDSGKKPSDFITEHQDISGKADKDTDAVEGNFAAFDSNGNPIDSGHKHSDYLTSHQDISGKADKVTGGTADNLAALDASGNLKDSGTSATELKSALDLKADLIRDTVQNVAIASVPDAAANLPLTALKFKVESIQSGSGDPYPPGGSAQKWDEEWESGTYNTSGAKANDDTRIRTKNAIAVQAETSYYFKSPATLGLRWYDSENSCITSANTTAKNEVITSPANAAYLRFSVVGVTSYGNDISVNYPSTDHDYHKWANIRPITGRTSAVVSNAPIYGLGTMLQYGLGDDGAVNSYAYYEHSEYIDLTGINTASIAFTGGASGGWTFRVCGYNASKTFVDLIDKQTLRASDYSFTYDVTDYAYLRVSLVSGCENIVFHAGTQTHTVQFGQDVYKGYVDWCEGVLALTHAVIDLGDMDRSWDISGAPNVSNAAIKNLVDIPANNNVVVDMICDKYRTVSRNQMNDSAIETCCAVNYGGMFIVKDPACNGMTKEQVKTYLTGTKIVYPLATPIEIPLSNLDIIKTAQTAGVNNFWADSGDIVELTYPCDTKGYIDKKITELTALVLES